MDWDSFKIDRFAKLMAVAFSSQENEALSALRMATRMLGEAGGTFDDVVEALHPPSPAVQTPEPPAPPRVEPAARPRDWLTGVVLERLARAEARVTILGQENEAFKKQLDDAIKYIVELESAIARSSGSA
ncbi:MAG: hypothetical protein HQL33_03900 [Alphaproteobacteria bacterium]|nr:hypothetical protein [Alphaproteobacteria bacterium]